MLAVFPEAADEPPIFGIQVGRIYFSARLPLPHVSEASRDLHSDR
jgi:hypothetical protein